MKYVLSFVGIAIIACAIAFCGFGKGSSNQDFMRIHIVANSNSTFDQNAKYVVKDAVVEFLIPMLADAHDKSEAEQIIRQNLTKINEVANAALCKQGAKYVAKVKIENEDMPTRAYGDLVVEEGVYESLRIELGNAKGDNWWCVVFPAVCFINSKNPQNHEYISKIWEIIHSVT